MPRKQEFELEIDAPPEAVWDAITTADGLRSWFSEDARVTPGRGGSVWVSWGGDEGGESAIEVWEPGARLRLADNPFMGAALVQEWTIETRGGKTLLRFVHSNFPDADDWDVFYDSLNRGWELFLRTLRHALERHPGEPRRTVYVHARLTGDDTDVWERLTRPGGVVASLAGEVLVSRPRETMLAVAPELDDGLVALSHEGDSVWCTVSAYGDARDRLDALEAPVRAEVEGVSASATTSASAKPS
jgi:uncharacterized protein YndB with AHSA1/START domain